MMIDGRTDFPEVGHVYRLVTRGMGGAVTSTPMIRVTARWMNKDGSRHITYMDMAEQQTRTRVCNWQAMAGIACSHRLTCMTVCV
jgi:hypothetical protein